MMPRFHPITKFLAVFFLVMFVLKVIDELHWDWWWVAAPLWAIPAVWLFFQLVLGAIWVIELVVDVVRSPRGFLEARRKRRQVRKMLRDLSEISRRLGVR